ncbi:MAG: aspartate kinase [bacterium]|nr:aspartate kinase [bacterium]
MSKQEKAVVCKFGGSSLAGATEIKRVKKIISADSRRRFVIPSAPGKRFKDDPKITDLLYIVHDLAAQDQPLGAPWQTIQERFLRIANRLKLRLDLRAKLTEIERAIEKGANREYVASRGEYLTALILAEFLQYNFVDAVEVIRFDKAGKLDPTSYELIANRCRESRGYVIAGFYGADPQGEVRTFSRGGTDYSGAVVARAVNATLYENWTDVSGMLMADPKIVPVARLISEITYAEVRELSYMGAAVFHDQAVFPVMDADIPIHIRNTRRPKDPGTMIVNARNPGNQTVVGVAGRKGFSVFHIAKRLMHPEIGFAKRVLDVFENHQISIEHLPTGIDTMSVVVSNDQLNDKADLVLDDLRSILKPDFVNLVYGLALIATVGLGMVNHPGTAAKLFSALGEAEINVLLIGQGSSQNNIIVGVKENDLPVAVRAIYKAFC